MAVDLATAAGAPVWQDAARYWAALDAATRDLAAPLGVAHLGALRWNTADLLRRADGVPIRVASKSIRVRELLEALLAVPGYRGVLAYTLPEALWLAGSIDDVVVGYPSADRAALRRLATDAELAARVTLMVDSLDQLDLVDAVLPPAGRAPVRVCLELDASLEVPVLGHLGVWRSPVRSPEQAGALAAAIAGRPGFRLVGVMAYEAQVAGVSNRPLANRLMQRASVAELVERRTAAVAAVRRHADLEFVNAGGTGSLETTAADPSVTEVTAGSGLLAGHLFDCYTHFTPAPAAGFALDVVRRPSPRHATLLGGGWIASGAAGRDRAPLPVWPSGLSLLARELAGEVQTPVTGAAAAALAVGDRVWFRHAKSGELAEHLDSLALVDDGRLVDRLPTYRGEGRVFL